MGKGVFFTKFNVYKSILISQTKVGDSWLHAFIF